MYFDDIFNTYWDDKNNFALCDKQRRTRDLVLYMLNRTQQIFEWVGLPDTIPAHNLEQLLQTCGNACITEVKDVPDGRGKAGLYAFFGGLGGMQNAYYEPTIYTVANPYLEFNKELEIGVDCVRARNDKFALGLIPLFVKYGAMLNENEISMNMLSICYRIDNLISADDDRTYESAKEFLNGIVRGQFGAISSTEFFDGIRNDKTSNGSRTIKDLIEYEQYLKASWFNEIGLNSNYNMKRERIVSAEAEMTDDALIPLVDNMIEWRLKACEEIREMYGDRYDLDGLTVKLNAIWDLDKMYVDMMPETQDAEPEDEESEEIGDDGTPTDDNSDVIGGDSDVQGDEVENEDDEPAGVIDININISTEENEENSERSENEEPEESEEDEDNEEEVD